MDHFNSLKLIRTISSMINKRNTVTTLGRWNLKDREDIKGSLANMDCCGDNLCGSPEEYKEKVNEILGEKIK